MDKEGYVSYNKQRVELRRAHRSMEGLVRLWAGRAVALCQFIDDEEELEEYLTPVLQAQRALDHDRRILVIGQSGSGKSSLLSWLANAPCIARAKQQKHYTCWRYCCRDNDATQSRFIPLPTLDGLELVDTAGCEREDTRKLCRTLMQGADVLLAVVHAANPEESPVWELLKQVPERLAGSCLLVVTHTDLLDTRSSLKLKDTLRNLCREQLRCTLPTCLLASKPSRADIEGIRALVQGMLEGDHGVRRAIHTLLERSLELVEKQSRILRSRESVSRTDSGFLAGIDREIDNFHARQVLGIDEHRRNLHEAVTKVIPELTQNVRKLFGCFFSPVTLLRLEVLGKVVDWHFQRLTHAAINSHQKESDALFCNSCASHWNSVRPRMKRNLSCEIGPFPQEELEEQVAIVRQRFCRDLYEPFATGGLRQRISSLFIAHSAWMNAMHVLCCSFIILAGILGALGQDAAGVACLFFWLLLCGGASLKTYFARQQLCRSVEALVRELCQSMNERLPLLLRHLISSRLAAYRDLYSLPREKVARQEALLRPLKKQRDLIHLQLRALIPHV